MEELRQREANLTALQAIGPRKKPRLDGPGNSGDVCISRHFLMDSIFNYISNNNKNFIKISVRVCACVCACFRVYYF